MSETKHTLPPWEIKELDNDKVIPQFTIVGKTKRGHSFYVAKCDRREDAFLIASALELRLTSFMSHFPVGAEVTAAKAAILKAKGQP
jgi:hypothetical protein